MFWDSKLIHYPLYNNLIKNYPEIKKEIVDYINIPNILVDYPNYKVPSGKMIYEKYWKATPCSNYIDEHVELNESKEMKDILTYLISQFRKHCPVTYNTIREEEEKGVLANSFISRLLPGTIINPHVGWTNKYLRMHLGIVTDPGCVITVLKESKTWEDGKILAFNDGDQHSVVHNGTKERIVFSMDINLKYLKQYMVP
jgi:hypothetical protein